MLRQLSVGFQTASLVCVILEDDVSFVVLKVKRLSVLVMEANTYKILGQLKITAPKPEYMSERLESRMYKRTIMDKMINHIC